jgi:hypothetical protein
MLRGQMANTFEDLLPRQLDAGRVIDLNCGRCGRQRITAVEHRVDRFRAVFAFLVTEKLAHEWYAIGESPTRSLACPYSRQASTTRGSVVNWCALTLRLFRLHLKPARSTAQFNRPGDLPYSGALISDQR